MDALVKEATGDAHGVDEELGSFAVDDPGPPGQGPM
jgi:hypothetical protein